MVCATEENPPEITDMPLFTAPVAGLLTPPENTDTAKYTFRYWKSSIDGEEYLSNTLNPADVDVTYTAVYLEEKVATGQNLLQFFRSIFERINLIFQYFATIFNFDLGE